MRRSIQPGSCQLLSGSLERSRGDHRQHTKNYAAANRVRHQCSDRWKDHHRQFCVVATVGIHDVDALFYEGDIPRGVVVRGEGIRIARSSAKKCSS